MAANEAANPEAIERLKVIDRIEVGPVRVEPQRCVARYAVTRGGRTEAMDLSYKYEEEVFTPNSPGAGNLAAVITAQVALNYGLFARELVFRGELDRRDQQFLEEMARNTAREIYVNKILAPNPFLIGDATGQQPVKRQSYLQAELSFPDAAGGGGAGAAPDGWWGAAADGARDGFAVLSSGGKESLLSFGILREIGARVVPVFINESGRHWFTALNAYRRFRDSVPGTARVWTSADRLFTWMARQLPFVRPDFARVRADIYPVRLWTVAVFLFGALPLLRKHGLGHLVIGDEHDTTRRVSYSGIPHYDGLYDQSRYFDNALSRYYRRKGWTVEQFSLLRSLSELLVEKVLVQRYPELQTLQVSCHSARVEGERVHPCGQCEKCRRVVAMLVAVGADPGRCGYSEAQVEACLAQLVAGEMHQEREVANHVIELLARQGALDRAAVQRLRPRPHPEVLKLRIDGERSPIETIPRVIRREVYSLLLQHADGAVQRSGRRWVDLDIMASTVIDAPSPHQRPAGEGAVDGPSGEQDHVLGRLTWPRARAVLEQVDVALLPVGSLEQHGPHLPLDTDYFDADYLAHRVAERCSRPRPIVLPVIPYGVSYHHAHFPGTVSVSPDTLASMVFDIGMSVSRHGIAKLVIVNGHGGNGPALHFAAQKINRDAKIFTCVDSGESSDPDIYALVETPNDVHAGEIETSTALATRPELVDLSAARRNVPRFSSRYLDFTSKRSVGWYAHTRLISRDGTMGDPTKASVEKGERMWELMIEHLSRLVEDLKTMSLDEIHQRRY